MAARTSAPVVAFGTGRRRARAGARTCGSTTRPRALRAGARRTRRADVTLRLVGAHQVANALAAAAVGARARARRGDVAAALSAAEPASRWRMEVTERPDGVTVVNDAYNANPESMRAALRALVAVGRRAPHLGGARRDARARRRRRRRARRRRPARRGARRRPARRRRRRRAAGARGAPLGAGLVGRVGHVPDVDAAVALLRGEVRPGDVVLVKASRAAGLERVAQACCTPRRRGTGAGRRRVRLILVAAGVGLIIVLFGTPLLIRLLRRHGLRPGDPRRDDGPRARRTTASAARRPWAASSMSSARVLGYVAAHLVHLARADGVRAAACCS